jgi:hypothetical protein
MFEEFSNPSNRSLPSSPDLVLSVFYLFGKLKAASAGQKFESTEELLLAIRE